MAVIRMFYEMNMDMRLAKEEDLLPLFELTNDRMVRQKFFFRPMLYHWMNIEIGFMRP